MTFLNRGFFFCINRPLFFVFYKLTFILLYLGAVYRIKYTFLTRIFKVAAVKLLLKTSVPVILAVYDKLSLPATETDMKVGKPSYLLKKYVYVLRVKRMFSIIYFRVRSKGHVSLLVCSFVCPCKRE